MTFLTRFASTRDWLLCLIVFLLIALSIVMRTYSEATNYLSPDSKFYLRVAQNVLNDKGLVAPGKYPFDESTPEHPFTVWPVGYPLMISAVSRITSLPVLPASKLLNLLLVAGVIIWLYWHDPSSSWFTATYLMTFGKMEIISYTWSELAFVFLMLMLVSFVSKPQLKFVDGIWLALILVGLFLVRYAGLILFFFTAIAMAARYLKSDKQSAVFMFFALLVSSVYVLLYFNANHAISGYYTGSDRIQPDWESIPYFTKLLLQGLANELSLARNYYYRGWPDAVYLTTIGVQALWLSLLVKKRRLISHALVPREMMMLFMGFFYLVAVVILRKISPFDPFDFRILAPFSAPVFLALFSWYHRQQDFFAQTKYWSIAFMTFCYFMTLPKEFILDLFKSVMGFG
jgi:hypothetical protein